MTRPISKDVRSGRAEEDGRRRCAIEGVAPEVDGGRFPIKRCAGDPVVVEADVVADGHDIVAAALRHRREDETTWAESPMTALGNDRFRGEFQVPAAGRYLYTVVAWVDHLASWRRGLEKKVAAGQDVALDLREGEELERLAAAGQARRFATEYARELAVVVDDPKARFSTWYELFPRSTSPEPGRHGTFRDVEARLPYVAAMGFDVLYLPPIHPIGRVNRKGRNNDPAARPDDPGSPWAIGSAEGGHKAVHRDLGTLDDFRRLVARARDQHGIEVALDLAFQCAPDHPYVRAHPDWFRRRPDGSIAYAENPPKKYQDIYPFDFESESFRELWDELLSVVRFWMREGGVRIFRVDNPHTKSFPFWEWVIGEAKRERPDAIFLSEAFTRPKVMYRLAKLGFTQSYTYFTWRTTKPDIVAYFSDLARGPVREFFRPSLWPNTPDILPEHLQHGGRPMFLVRLVLAATLGASYGIYGPAFELLDARPLAPGREEYLDSEKYEIKAWDLDRKDSLRDAIARVNRIRRENKALQADDGLRFHPTTDDSILAYSKATPDLSNVVFTVVNLDPHHVRSADVEMPLETLGIEPGRPFQVHDLLSDARFLWHGARNRVELDPRIFPAQVFRLRRQVRREGDFEYFA